MGLLERDNVTVDGASYKVDSSDNSLKFSSIGGSRVGSGRSDIERNFVLLTHFLVFPQ